jgi:hypothetical protein
MSEPLHSGNNRIEFLPANGMANRRRTTNFAGNQHLVKVVVGSNKEVAATLLAQYSGSSLM